MLTLFRRCAVLVDQAGRVAGLTRVRVGAYTRQRITLGDFAERRYNMKKEDYICFRQSGKRRFGVRPLEIRPETGAFL